MTAVPRCIVYIFSCQIFLSETFFCGISDFLYGFVNTFADDGLFIWYYVFHLCSVEECLARIFDGILFSFWIFMTAKSIFNFNTFISKSACSEQHQKWFLWKVVAMKLALNIIALRVIFYLVRLIEKWVSWVNWLFNVTINDISVIRMWRHMRRWTEGEVGLPVGLPTP